MSFTVKTVADQSSVTGLFQKPSLLPATIVIFGATGDLAMRKLFPALYNLYREDRLPEDVAILCVARSAVDPDVLFSRLKEGIRRYSRSGLDPLVWTSLASRIAVLTMSYTDTSGYTALADQLGIRDAQNRERRYLFYLATPPTSFPVIVDGLGRHGIVTPSHHEEGPLTRVIFEKPFGRDIHSALELNRMASLYMDESQMFRMDHYLGKETVQNILVFRFANAVFEPIWNRRYIHHVRITAFEDIGIEGRGKFYEETGIVRDVLQNHLLQILALCAMEPPASFAAERLRDERAKVLSAIRPLHISENNLILGRYREYLKEKDVPSDSTTPTLVSLRLFVDNWRWEGVPFVLSAGKALHRKSTQIEIHFDPVPLCLFENQQTCTRLEPNVLTIRLQPEEGITLRFGAKTPGDTQDVSAADMHFDFTGGFGAIPIQEAYEKLLLDCLRGNQTLFARQDEVHSMWRFVAPLLDETVRDRILLAEYDKGEAPMEMLP